MFCIRRLFSRIDSFVKVVVSILDVVLKRKGRHLHLRVQLSILTFQNRSVFCGKEGS